MRRRTAISRSRIFRRWLPAVTLGAILAVGMWISFLSSAAPVSITIPLSPTSVSDVDLDGDPTTGTWTDALSVTIPLDNGAPSPYGTAVLYAKHDGSNLYLRIDGSIDVPWVNAVQDHFWLGIQISRVHTSHHGGGEWDGTFFGLWNGAEYVPTPVYPPRAIDTHGFDRPPLADTLQDVFGILRYSGSLPPYNFTAEWRRSLESLDNDDLVYVADGATTYNFFVTTDSDGGGSQGGSISHREMTNLNSFKIEATGMVDMPPTITHEPPLEIVTGEATTVSARVVDLQGVTEVRMNYTDVIGVGVNASMALEGSFYVYVLPAQNISGTLAYFLWASDVNGNEARTGLYEIRVAKLLKTPSLIEAVSMGSGCLLIRWEESSDPDLAGYRLYRWNTSSKEMVGIATLTVNDTSYLDCNLEPGRSYTYWLVAFDSENNESPPSAMINGRTDEPSGSEPGLSAIWIVVVVAVASTAVAITFVILRRRST